jgi:hypothetical protein
MRLKLSMRTLSPGKTGGTVSRLLKAAFKDAQPKIAALIIDRVGAEANKTFRGMAPLYIEALNKPDTVKLTDAGIEVQLGTKIAQAMDDGAPAYDLKRALLANTKKSSKTGTPYVDIPFKHTTSGARGTTQLPAAVKKAITARAANQSARGSTQTTRLPMKTPGKKFTRVLLKRRSGVPGLGKVKQSVSHKRGLHDDLIRTRTKGRGGRGSTSYSTIRRISAKSSPSSWWHPGFKGAGLLKKVLPKLKPEIAAILSDSVAKVRGR